MGGRPSHRLGAPLKRDSAAGLIREKIAGGTLQPGAAVPSAAALARETGYSVQTCRAALRALVKDKTLVPGVSRGARLRVAEPGAGGTRPDALRVALSRQLAERRRDAGLTQPELAEKIGMSLTAVGHAETGRVWQSREFWRRAGQVLGDDGYLLRLYDLYQADEHAPVPDTAGSAEPGEPAPARPVLPVSVTIGAEGVTVVWPDGTETLATPPGRQDRPRVRHPGG